MDFVFHSGQTSILTAGLINRSSQAMVGPLRGRDGRQHSRSFARKVDAVRWLKVSEAETLTGQWVDPTSGAKPFGPLRLGLDRRQAVHRRGQRPRTPGLRCEARWLPEFGAKHLKQITADKEVDSGDDGGGSYPVHGPHLPAGPRPDPRTSAPRCTFTCDRDECVAWIIAGGRQCINREFNRPDLPRPDLSRTSG